MSDHRLGAVQIMLLAAYAAGMAGGQLMFKLAAERLTPGAGVGERLIAGIVVIAAGLFLVVG